MYTTYSKKMVKWTNIGDNGQVKLLSIKLEKIRIKSQLFFGLSHSTVLCIRVISSHEGGESCVLQPFQIGWLRATADRLAQSYCRQAGSELLQIGWLRATAGRLTQRYCR